MVTLCICPDCNGRSETENRVELVCEHTGRVIETTVHTWRCDLCAGGGRVPRETARSRWLNPAMSASA